MSGNIKESDWKQFKVVREQALERYSQQTMDEVQKILWAEGRGSFQKSDEILQLLIARQQERFGVFDSLRRSTALMQLHSFWRMKLITEKDLAAFSAETQEQTQRWI